MNIARGTTPTITVRLPYPVDLTGTEVFATLKQDEHSLRKTGEDLTVTARMVRFELTQEESLGFVAGVNALLQLNWVYPNGNRGATKIISIPVTENLEGEVLGDE